MTRGKNGAVLVTGGAGYIGAHACKALATAGFLPVTFDNLSRGHRAFVKWGPLEQGDVRDRKLLDAAFQRWKPKAVMHFAALASVAESVAHPDLYQDVNVKGSRNVIDGMVDHGVKCLIFSSTASVYGHPEKLPITEETPIAPINPYGASKAAVESEIMERSGALAFAILRYFNAAGADPAAEVGEDHEPETHLIPNAIKASLGAARHLDVFGVDYSTPDGTCVRDYVHVSDIADAHVLALKALLGGDPSFVCDLGTGSGTSVRDIIKAVAMASGKAVPFKERPRRLGDPPALYTSGRGAREILQWSPKRSDLKTIIGDALKWQLRGK
ncbi:MAG: UDP-glucose 4-epimerase GalE [Alphaproteobacteria bacterium]